METVQWNVGRYVAVRRMDGVPAIFDSIRAVHPELSGHALVAQARVLNAAHSFGRMIFPYMGIGTYGQFIFISPKTRVVIVRTADEDGSGGRIAPGRRTANRQRTGLLLVLNLGVRPNAIRNES
jgi:hypothetical protein